MASRTWVRFNEDSRAKNNRARHIAEHGGEFVKGSNGWAWKAPKSAPVAVKKAAEPTKTDIKKKGKKK
jgi:hypothetical protein